MIVASEERGDERARMGLGLALPRSDAAPALGAARLAEHAGDNGETCMPAPGLLRRMTGLSRRGVAKTLNALEAVRLIAREPSGCEGATRYRLLLDRPGSALDCPGAKREGGPKDGP